MNNPKNIIGYSLMTLSCIIVASSLIAILFFIFSNGVEGLSLEYLTTANTFENTEIVVEQFQPGAISYEINNDAIEVTQFDNDLAITSESDLTGVDSFEIKRINDIPVAYIEDTTQIDEVLTNGSDVKLNVSLHREGILSMIIATLLSIFLTLAIALPLGISTAIYLVEYPIKSRLYEITNFSINALTAIPSIVFGLFGSLFFMNILGLPMSILTGSLTMSIMILPIVIRSTQEALLSVDDMQRQASRGLGADEVETIFKIVLPSAMPGIIVGIILAIGRVIGESAILVFTAGTVDKLTLNPLESSSTLTVKAYMLAKEYGDIAGACSIAVIIIIIVIFLNLIAKSISKKFELGV